MKKLVIIILLLSGLPFLAQVKDTTMVNPFPDSLRVQINDSAKTSAVEPKGKYDVDAVVNASASDSLIFDVNSKKMYIYGTGDLQYKDTDLKGGKILVNYETSDLEAFGIADTADTAKTKLKQTPVLKEGTEQYEGSRLRYNFKTQRGFISMAKNQEQNSRYEGDKVNKVDKNTYFIEDGMFTTCDSDTPDTYFTASEMKVIQKIK